MFRVCSFESRRAAEMRSLIERHGGEATLAPSLREIPIENNAAALAFGEELARGQIDIVLFLTGVGAQGLLDVLLTRYTQEQIQANFARTIVIVRGPKPVAILRNSGIRVDYRAAEPNTWREVIQLVDDTPIPLAGQTLALQEYGQPQRELAQELEKRLANVISVPVYKWELPEDLGPLESSIRRTIAGDFDLLLFTSAQQAIHVLEIADRLQLREAWMAAARKCAIGSIGPTASETLRELGLSPDIEPSHGKMGHLVIESIGYLKARQCTSSTKTS